MSVTGPTQRTDADGIHCIDDNCSVDADFLAWMCLWLCLIHEQQIMVSLKTSHLLTCCPEQMPSLWHEGECESECECARAMLD